MGYGCWLTRARNNKRPDLYLDKIVEVDMLNLRTKLLIPTLLTALLALSGIVYISILQYNSFIEHTEGHAVERREHLHLLLGGLQEQTRDLTELLSNKWDFLDTSLPEILTFY